MCLQLGCILFVIVFTQIQKMGVDSRRSMLYLERYVAEECFNFNDCCSHCVAGGSVGEKKMGILGIGGMLYGDIPDHFACSAKGL